MALTKAKLIADGVIDVDNLAAGHSITTSNIGEGSNLYYTDARVASHLTTNSYATESFVTTGYLPLSGGTVSGNLTVTGSLTGTLATSAQTNITSLGTLSSLAVSGDVSIADKIIHTGDTDTSIRFLANNNVTIETAGVERVRVDPSGNFGVNTNNAKAVTGTFYPASGWQVQQFAGETDAALIVNGLNGVARIHLVANTASANQKSYIIQSDSGNLAFASLNDNLSGSEKLRILSSGGITFNGDTADANALDDYEEGTWTPLPAWGPSQGTSTYTSAGFYTKIGNVVHVYGRVGITSIGNATGNFTIVGLPFAASNLYGGSPVYLLLGGVTATSPIQAYIEAGTTFVSFEQTNNGTQSPLTHANVTTGDFVFVRATYTV